jgi:hypothetical protein
MIVDIDTLVKAELSISQYLLACFIVENNQDGFIEYTNACGRFHLLDIQRLVGKKYLIYNGDGNTYNFYELFPTQRLADLMEQMKKEEGIFKSLVVIEEVKKSPVVDDFDSFSSTFRELFPKNIRPAGKPVRSSLLDIRKKLKAFEKEYPGYTREEILTATAHYVERYRKKGYSFMRTATYFIHKQNEGSDLATEIDSIRDKGLQNEINLYGTQLI